MYDFTGQECPICKKKFTAADDIVVCPECGTPHHRTCWQENGFCANQDQHADGFEWTPAAVHQAQANPESDKTVNQPSQPEQPNAANTQQNTTSDTEKGQNGSGFDYSQLYNNTYTPPQQSAQAQEGAIPNIDPDSTIENIPVSDWSAFLGKSNYLYMMLFKQMELLHRRVAVSFSAMMFGPFYFAYRKAWKPALLLAATLLLIDTPSILYMLQATGSPLTAGMNGDFLYRLAAAASVLNFAVMILRGLYGFYWYKKNCIQQISKIRAAYPDANQRKYVLRAKGGTSWAAVFLMAGALLLLGIVLSLFVGPNTAALYNLLA